MKRELLAWIATGVLVVLLGAASVFAASAAAGNHYQAANGDGICDNRKDDKTCPQDGAGKRAGHCGALQGKNYADENGDGICDNCADDKACPKDGTGKKLRQREKLQKSECTDENNSGVCDNAGKNAGTGKQHGCRRARIK